MGEYFYGWYFKCQAAAQTLAVIPAFHESNGKKSCSIQLITDEQAWNIPYLCQDLHINRKQFCMMLGQNIFSKKGMKLNLCADGLTACGAVRFGAFTPLRYDIMGPFCSLPGMECRHSVYSMMHTVNGSICVNGNTHTFTDGIGYTEGDRGTSFPKEYAWTHSFFEDGSLMLSVADIPLGNFHFTGIIGVIYWYGKEYRLATYLGAKVIKNKEQELIVKQGAYTLTAALLDKNAHTLAAPDGGAMTRTIRENPACCASYCFRRNEQVLFSFTTEKASFEYEYPS